MVVKGRRLLLGKGWTFLFILSISIDEIKGGVLGMKNIPKADAIAITTLLRVEIGQHCQLTIYGYDCVCVCVSLWPWCVCESADNDNHCIKQH